MLNPVTSQQLAIISTTVMLAREDFDFRKEWKGVCSCIPMKSHFYVNLYPKGLTGLSVPDCPLFGPHCTLSVWINGLACGHCSAHSWVYRSLLLVGWLLGCCSGFIYETCWTELFRDGVQRAAGSLGGAWSRCAWSLGAASVLEAVELAVPFLEGA